MCAGGKVNKTVAGIAALVVLGIVGVIGFVVLRQDGKNQASVAAPQRSASPGAAEAAGADATLPALPTPSLPANAEDAKVLMEINQIIFEVTQQAMQRPKTDRMTAEEIDALIRSRIEELKARP